MNKFKIVFFVVFVIFASGCASTTGNHFAEEITPKSFGEYSMSFEDKRLNTEERKLNIPIVSVPWQKDTVSPSLAVDKLEDDFEVAVKPFLTSGDKKVDFDILVLEASQSFVANTFSETEIVNWKIKLLANIKGRLISEAEGECTEKRSSTDASHNKVNEMYSACFKSSIQQALYRLDLQSK